MHRSPPAGHSTMRSEEHTSELQSLRHLVCRLLLEKKLQDLRFWQTMRWPVRHYHVLTLWPQFPALALGRPQAGWRHPDGGRAVSVEDFFFNNRAPAQFFPLPQPVALRI